ncbi:hypothetical protein COSO111634_19330 [Corallococcus soli]
MDSTVRSTYSPTSTSGPTPCFTSARASRFAFASSSAYVSWRPSATTATAPGTRSTCASKRSWMLSDGTASAVWFHVFSTC